MVRSLPPEGNHRHTAYSASTIRLTAAAATRSVRPTSSVVGPLLGRIPGRPRGHPLKHPGVLLERCAPAAEVRDDAVAVDGRGDGSAQGPLFPNRSSRLGPPMRPHTPRRGRGAVDRGRRRRLRGVADDVLVDLGVARDGTRHRAGVAIRLGRPALPFLDEGRAALDVHGRYGRRCRYGLDLALRDVPTRVGLGPASSSPPAHAAASASTAATAATRPGARLRVWLMTPSPSCVRSFAHPRGRGHVRREQSPQVTAARTWYSGLRCSPVSSTATARSTASHTSTYLR